MAALRWFLFSIVAFGGGAAGAFALHPPELGVPAATAANLRGHLTKIQSLAAAGKCDELRTELRQTQNAVDSASTKVSATVETQLRNAFDRVDRTARTTCSDALQATNTKPEPEPEPTPATTPAEPEPSTPSGGDEAGGPDPGSDEGTTPSGGGTGGTTPSGAGGATLTPNGIVDRARDRVQQLRSGAGR